MSDKEKELTEEQLKKARGGRGEVDKNRELSEEELEDVHGARGMNRGEEPRGGDQERESELD